MSPYINIIRKNQKKKIHELYFSSRHWFWTDSVYSDFDWSGSGGELDSKDRHGGTIQRLQKTPLSFTKNMAPNQYTAPDIAKIWLLITIAPEYASILPLVQVYCKVELALELTKMAVKYIYMVWIAKLPPKRFADKIGKLMSIRNMSLCCRLIVE